MEAWTLTEAAINRIYAFEMWACRRMLQISWVDRVKNEGVLRRINTELQLIHVVQIKKLKSLDHVTRNRKYELLLTNYSRKDPVKKRPRKKGLAERPSEVVRRKHRNNIELQFR